MFEDSLVESTHRIHAQNRWTFALSVGVQAALAAAIVMLPLLHPETLQRLALSPPVLVAPPPPPPPPPRVVIRTDAAASGPAAPAAPTFVQAVFHSAVDRILRAQASPEAPPGLMTSLSMVAGNDPAGIGEAMGPTTGRPGVTVAAPPKAVRISGGVLAGLLLAPIQPAYPAIAKASHTEGTVVIHAIVSKTGRIESANVLSGPAMLQGAAMDAVRVARYKPFLLNGEPTEVDTTITINFRLSSG